MAFSTLFLDASSGSGTMDGIKDMVSDLSQTIGVDLFEEDIDNVVFQTNEFLCNSDFIGSQGPFWWILQMSMALGALFSIIVAGGMAYKMMVKNEPIDVFKIMKVLGIAIVMCFWYPPSMSGFKCASNACILDALAYIPNCIGSYTHDLYEAEATQVSDKYNELMPLIQKRDKLCDSISSPIKSAAGELQNVQTSDVQTEATGTKSVSEGLSKAKSAETKSTFAGLMIGLDKVVMFFALVIYRIGWWSTIFCQQILLGMLTIFGPIQWAFSVLPLRRFLCLIAIRYSIECTSREPYRHHPRRGSHGRLHPERLHDLRLPVGSIRSSLEVLEPSSRLGSVDDTRGRHSILHPKLRRGSSILCEGKCGFSDENIKNR